MYCKVSIIFAYISIIYMLTSLFYLFAITVDIVESPLNEALKSNPELMAVKIKSRENRKKLFLISGVIALILVIIFRPFQIENSINNQEINNQEINNQKINNQKINNQEINNDNVNDVFDIHIN